MLATVVDNHKQEHRTSYQQSITRMPTRRLNPVRGANFIANHHAPQSFTTYSLRVSRPIEFARKTLKKRHLALAA
jgi:arylamine N-acetyltransferase